MSMTLNRIRRALSSVVLKISLAAIFIVQAIIITGEGWCGFHHWCPRESFLTRIDASLCVLVGTVFLFFATKQVLQGRLDRRASAYEGATTAPLDLDPRDELFLLVELPGNLKPVTNLDWWIQTSIDA